MKPFEFLKPAGEAIFKDSYTTKANELLVPYEKGKRAEFGMVGFPLSKPSISHSGASTAPEAIRRAFASFSVYSGEVEQNLEERILDFGDVLMHPTDIQASQHRITEGLREAMEENAVSQWFLLGGDHSITYSTVKALAEHHKVGILQFDAHHDLRNTEDGGPTNGTPFRRLLEDGVIKGEQISQIGIRNFMNAKGYHEYAMENKVAVYTMDAVRSQGIEAIVTKELERLAGISDFIYLSVDMDVLDQAFAPGCPAIGPGGMDTDTLLQGIRVAAKQEQVKAMDIVEIDPTQDIRAMTSKTAAYLMLSYMKEKG
jgi:formiminoglutamase